MSSNNINIPPNNRNQRVPQQQQPPQVAPHPQGGYGAHNGFPPPNLSTQYRFVQNVQTNLPPQYPDQPPVFRHPVYYQPRANSQYPMLMVQNPYHPANRFLTPMVSYTGTAPQQVFPVQTVTTVDQNPAQLSNPPNNGQKPQQPPQQQQHPAIVAPKSSEIGQQLQQAALGIPSNEQVVKQPPPPPQSTPSVSVDYTYGPPSVSSYVPLQQSSKPKLNPNAKPFEPTELKKPAPSAPQPTASAPLPTLPPPIQAVPDAPASVGTAMPELSANGPVRFELGGDTDSEAGTTPTPAPEAENDNENVRRQFAPAMTSSQPIVNESQTKAVPQVATDIPADPVPATLPADADVSSMQHYAKQLSRDTKPELASGEPPAITDDQAPDETDPIEPEVLDEEDADRPRVFSRELLLQIKNKMATQPLPPAVEQAKSIFTQVRTEITTMNTNNHKNDPPRGSFVDQFQAYPQRRLPNRQDSARGGNQRMQNQNFNRSSTGMMTTRGNEHPDAPHFVQRPNPTQNAFVPSSRRVKNDHQKCVDGFRREFNILSLKNFPERREKIYKMFTDTVDTTSKFLDVLDMIFEKIILESTFSSLYAALLNYICTEKNVQLKLEIDNREDDRIFTYLMKGGEDDLRGDHIDVKISRGIINKCQQEFERDRRGEAKLEKLTAEHRAMEAELKALNAQLAAIEPSDVANYTSKKEEVDKTDSALRQKALDLMDFESNQKVRSLGNIRFIGELCKYGLLPLSIIGKCFEQLKKNVKDVEKMEGLQKLVLCIGPAVPREPGKKSAGGEADFIQNSWVNIFHWMKERIDKQDVTVRIKFAFQDAIDLKNNGWVHPAKERDEQREEMERREIEETIRIDKSSRRGGYGGFNNHMRRNQTNHLLSGQRRGLSSHASEPQFHVTAHQDIGGFSGQTQAFQLRPARQQRRGGMNRVDSTGNMESAATNLSQAGPPTPDSGSGLKGSGGPPYEQRGVRRVQNSSGTGSGTATPVAGRVSPLVPPVSSKPLPSSTDAQRSASCFIDEIDAYDAEEMGEEWLERIEKYEQRPGKFMGAFFNHALQMKQTDSNNTSSYLSAVMKLLVESRSDASSSSTLAGKPLAVTWDLYRSGLDELVATYIKFQKGGDECDNLRIDESSRHRYVTSCNCRACDAYWSPRERGFVEPPSMCEQLEQVAQNVDEVDRETKITWKWLGQLFAPPVAMGMCSWSMLSRFMSFHRLLSSHDSLKLRSTVAKVPVSCCHGDSFAAFAEERVADARFVYERIDAAYAGLSECLALCLKHAPSDRQPTSIQSVHAATLRLSLKTKLFPLNGIPTSEAAPQSVDVTSGDDVGVCVRVVVSTVLSMVSFMSRADDVVGTRSPLLCDGVSCFFISKEDRERFKLFDLSCESQPDRVQLLCDRLRDVITPLEEKMARPELCSLLVKHIIIAILDSSLVPDSDVVKAVFSRLVTTFLSAYADGKEDNLIAILDEMKAFASRTELQQPHRPLWQIIVNDLTDPCSTVFEKWHSSLKEGTTFEYLKFLVNDRHT